MNNPQFDPEIQRASWSLLAEWWCVPKDSPPDQLIAVILMHSAIPVSDPALVRDRLYGGFACEDPRKRHVCYYTGQYTYLGDNVPLTPQERQDGWHELLEENAEQSRPGDGPFTDDVPKPSHDSERATLEEWTANVEALLKEVDLSEDLP